MSQSHFDQTTDSHLAKKYNDALFDCMMRCNMTGYVMKSEPHFDNLVVFHAAVDTFFNNTFFLFENVKVEIKKGEKISLSMLLIQQNNEIENDLKEMKHHQKFRSTKHYSEVQTKVSYLHKMIMFGLQQRQMLVRMSDREPRGSESIQYWNDKIGFKKGNILSDVDVNQRITK